MGEDEFWLSTPRYFAARQKAYFEQFKNGWEQTRFIAFVVAKTVDSKRKIKKPADLLPFSWDAKVKKRKKLTADEIAQMKAFDEEADLILQKTNPEAWAKYQAAKKAEEQANNKDGD